MYVRTTWSMPSCSIGKFFNMKYPIYDKQGTVSENDIDADGGITKITAPSISTYTVNPTFELFSNKINNK